MDMRLIYEKEIEALRLIEHSFDNLSEDEVGAKHYSLLHTIEALVEVGLLTYVKEEPVTKEFDQMSLVDLIVEQKVKVQREELMLLHCTEEYPNRPAEREMNRLLQTLLLLKGGVKVESYRQGLVLVDGLYIYALATGKWRMKGKSTWYKSKSPAQFVEEFVRK